MITIIAGSRGISDLNLVEEAIKESGFDITEVVSGGARGVDFLGESWATENHIPIKRFPADWEKYGRRAGAIRNELMGDYAEALIAVILNNSRGSEHMVRVANHRELKVFVKRVFLRDRVQNILNFVEQTA